MPIGGGGAREWLAPLDPKGNANTDSPSGARIVGCHKGFYAGMNAGNPRPGHAYQWIGSNPKEVFLARQRGWQIVNDKDDDAPAYLQGIYNDEDSDQPTPLDTTGVFQDVVYVRTTEENYRTITDQINKQSKAQIEGGTREFLEGASPEERATGQTQKGYVPTRFARSEHGAYVQEGDEVKEMIPQRGIVKE